MTGAEPAERAAMAAEPFLLGEGRTIAAGSASARERIVVLTTIGLSIHDGDDPMRLIERRSTGTELLVTSPSGNLAAVSDSATGELELWNLDDGVIEFSVAATDPGDRHFWATLSDDGTVVHSSASRVARFTAAGEQSVVIGAPENGSLGPAVAVGDLHVAAVLGSNDVLVSVGPESNRLTLDLGADVVLGEMATGADGSLAVEMISMSDPADDQLGLLDATDLTNSERAAPLVAVPAPSLASAAWSPPRNDVLALASPDQLHIVDLSGSQLGRADLGDLGPSTSVSPMDGGRFMTTHERDIVVWAADGTRLTTLVSSVAPLQSVNALDGGQVLIVDGDGTVRLVQIDGSELTIDRSRTGAVTSVAVSPDQRFVAVARTTGEVELHDASTGQVTGRLDHDNRHVDSVAIAPDSASIVTGIAERLGHEAFDDTVTTWDTETVRSVAEHSGDGHPVAGCSFFRNIIRFSPDGSLLAATSHDFTVTIFRASDLEPLRSLPPHLGSVLDVAFSPDGSMLATSSDDWTVRLWDVEDDREIAEFPAEIGGYWALAFDPTGSTLATIGATGTVNVIDLDDGRVVQTFDESANWRSNLVYAPDGTSVMAGGKDDDVIVWRADDGAVSSRFVGHSGPVEAVDVSPDGLHLISGSTDGTVRSFRLSD